MQYQGIYIHVIDETNVLRKIKADDYKLIHITLIRTNMTHYLFSFNMMEKPIEIVTI